MTERAEATTEMDNKEKNTGQFGELKVLAKENDLFYLVEIAVMREGLNRNGWDYRNADKYAETFMGCPILTAYVGNKIGDGPERRRVLLHDVTIRRKDRRMHWGKPGGYSR